MPTYLMLTTLTAQGVQTLKANPNRLREVNRDVEELGAKVLHQWATIGEYDFVNVVEAPDAATIACARSGPTAGTVTLTGTEDRTGGGQPATAASHAAAHQRRLSATP